VSAFDSRLLELMQPLEALCPPAIVIDKTRYSALAEPGLAAHLRQREADPLIVSGSETMFVCWQRCWTRLISATASSSFATRYAARLTKVTTCSCGSITPAIRNR